MKLIMGLMAAVFAVSLTGCNQIKSGFQTENSLAVLDTGTLQGRVFDATTGKPIGGTDLKITLIQGASDRTPDRLVTTTGDALEGEYAFTNIPVERSGNGGGLGTQYKITVSKAGYQPFASEFGFEAANTLNQLGNTAVKYNKIGNIYLYPTTAVPTDVTIYVTDNFGAKIADGTTVQLVPDTSATPTTGINLGQSTNILVPTSVLPYISATTTNGTATFTKTSLTLGAKYTPTVVSTGKFGSKNGTVITVGISATSANGYSQTIALSPVNFGSGNLALSAESTAGGKAAPVSTGKLIAIYNEPVSFDSNFKWSGALTCSRGSNCCSGGICNVANGTISGVNNTVSAVAVATGSSLELTPTLPSLTGASAVSITYNQDTSGSGYGAQAYLTSTGENVTTAAVAKITPLSVKISN